MLLLYDCFYIPCTGELLVEELLQHGQSQMLELIEKVVKRLNEAYNGRFVLYMTCHDIKSAFTTICSWIYSCILLTL